MGEIKEENIHIPEPVLCRLPWYLAFAKIVREEGGLFLSSTQIAKGTGVDASLITKDLSFVRINGKTRVGYEVSLLIAALEDFLGFRRSHRAFLFGVGSLGAALLHDNGLNQFGLSVQAGFDIDPLKIGTYINNIPIRHADHYLEIQTQTNIEIGILTVPPDQAQKVAELMLEGGIKAIWNFAPYRIRVPKNIIVQDTSIYSHLAVIFNRLIKY